MISINNIDFKLILDSPFALVDLAQIPSLLKQTQNTAMARLATSQYVQANFQ